MGEPWFGVKSYGIGLSPRTRAGWISVLVYVLAVTGLPVAGWYLHAPPWVMLVGILVPTATFLALMSVKSDLQPRKGRWGGRQGGLRR